MVDSPETSLHNPPPELVPVTPKHHQMKTKTRFFPNLSECHCCNRQFNSKSPKTHLRILTSEWRIVLLCNFCYYLVESSQFCSYCLSRVFDSYFECKCCHRKIHRSCADKFSGNGIDFSICFDCTVPEWIENEYVRVQGSRNRKRVRYHENSTCFSSSRVCDLLDKGRTFDEIVNEANLAAEKKVAVAIVAREKAFAKALVAMRAIEFAIGALSFVKVDKSGGGGGGDDDDQLMVRLCKSMSGSSSICRNLCLFNSCSKNVPVYRNSAVVRVGEDASIVDTNSLSCEERDGFYLTVTRQGCGMMDSGVQNERCRDGCLITYTRRKRGSLHGNRPFRVYARRSSSVSFC